MSTPTPVKSTQIVAGVAVVLALLGGAYAVGRSQGVSGEPPAAPLVAEASQKPAQPDARREEVLPRADEVRKPVQLARADTGREAAPAVEREPQPAALCHDCGRVVAVHAETRQGQGSGVGAVGGAVVGGLLGNMIGGGNGRKLATVGGAVAGGYAGNEIEKNQKSRTVWVVKIEERDGRVRRFERSADPGLRVGDEVRLTQSGFERR
ncbi:MAG: glycine zipper 2TM domain-containing protein [Comamonadaceae bacterium]|nr:glycine zipper 2TM domain-containing protein [Comamonadaceae bacterium]